MNYIKVINTDRVSMEKMLNVFYKETQEKGHRIQYTKAHWFDDGTVDVLMVINDEPHPHR